VKSAPAATPVVRSASGAAVQVSKKEIPEQPVKHEAPQEDPIPETVAVKPAPGFSLTVEQVQEKWEQVITALSRVKMSVSTYLNEGAVSKVEPGAVTVTFSRNHSLHKEALESKDNKALIEKHLFDVFGHPLRVSFVLSKEEKSNADNTNHSGVKSVMDMFHGRLI
jgi:hypothetical protein